MKKLIIILSIIITSVSIGLAVRFSVAANKAQNDLHQERYTRMTAEEGWDKASDQIVSLESELMRAQNKMKSLEKALEQANAFNGDLKGRLDKASQIKETLDMKIKELEQLAGSSAALSSTASQ